MGDNRMTPRQRVLYGLSIAFLFAGMFGLRWSHGYWWVFTTASILCGLAVLRPSEGT